MNVQGEAETAIEHAREGKRVLFLVDRHEQCRRKFEAIADLMGPDGTARSAQLRIDFPFRGQVRVASVDYADRLAGQYFDVILPESIDGFNKWSALLRRPL